MKLNDLIKVDLGMVADSRNGDIRGMEAIVDLTRREITTKVQRFQSLAAYTEVCKRRRGFHHGWGKWVIHLA